MANQIIVTDFDLDTMPDDIESIENQMREILLAHDRNRWALGDLGSKAETTYGDGTLKNLAPKVNCRTATLYEYKRLSEFYPRGYRHLKMCSWSHYRAAMRLGKLDSAYKLLERVSSENMSYESLCNCINLQLGKSASAKIFDAVVTISRHKGKVHFDCPVDLTDGQEYRVVMYEA